MPARSNLEADWVTTQAQLLTDSCLRESFRKDPIAVATQLNIRPSEQLLFVELDADQLEAQAATLVNKRLHEVHGLMPRTFRALGVKAQPYFLSYSTTFWPKGHHRHLVDAVRFRV